MNEDKVIEQIARPIIEQLKKLDNSEIQKKWNQIPKIHFVRDDGMEGPLVIDIRHLPFSKQRKWAHKGTH